MSYYNNIINIELPSQKYSDIKICINGEHGYIYIILKWYCECVKLVNLLRQCVRFERINIII